MNMKLSHVYAVCTCALLSLAATTSGDVFAQKAPNKKETTAQKAHGVVPVDRIAAVVNHDVITEIQLQQRVHQAATNLRRRNIALPPMENLRDQTLDRMILERIIEQKARDTGIRVDDNMLNGAIEQIAVNNGLTVPQLEKRLAQDGISFPSFKNEIRGDLITQRLRERDVDDKIQIPESEIDQYLKDQNTPAKRMEYRLSRIVITFPENPTRAQLEEAQRKASIALEQAQRGADFAQLAAKYSAAPEAMDGGVMGWVPAGKLPPFLLNAVQNHKAGDIIPVQAGNSFQILKLNALRDPGEQAEQCVQQTHIRHIMMRPSNVTPENVVIQRLKDIKSKLDKGEGDFQTLARLYSADPSGTRGGDLGWLYPGDVPPEMEKAFDGLTVGEISEPIKTPYGWHIFQVIDRRTKSGINERQRMQAREALREQKLGDAVLDWERQLMSEAYVDKRINKHQD